MCLALSILSFLLFSTGILLLAEIPLSAPVAVGLAVGIVLMPIWVLFYKTKPEGEKLARIAERLNRKARSEEEEVDQLWGMIDDLRSKLRKKSNELKDANAEVAKLEDVLSKKSAELAELKEALSKKESPAVTSPPQEKRKGRGPTLPEELLELKADRWKFSKFIVKGKEYVKVRRTAAKGKREERSLGRLDDEMKGALEAAGISLR